MEKLNVKALAGGLGVSWAVCMLFVGWACISCWGTGLVEVFSSVYIGFAPTFTGGLMGAIWGFIDGAMGVRLLPLCITSLLRNNCVFINFCPYA